MGVGDRGGGGTEKQARARGAQVHYPPKSRDL